MDLTTRTDLVRNLLTSRELPASTGATLLGVNRTSIYYHGVPIPDEELECKTIIDRLHTDNPTWGARQMSDQLKLRGHNVGRKKARRYMAEMDITPIYPKMNLSKRMKEAKVCPYLLRDAVITRPNLVARPEILNSDQGCQFTSQRYIDFLKANGVRQSMDGKSRWADNIMVERWFEVIY